MQEIYDFFFISKTVNSFCQISTEEGPSNARNLWLKCKLHTSAGLTAVNSCQNALQYRDLVGEKRKHTKRPKDSSVKNEAGARGT